MNTQDRNALVRTTWNLVQRDADAFSTCFYQTLFDLDPMLAPMFRTDMARQRARLVAMIDAAVCLLDRPDDLMPALRALGERHGRYGVRDEHYGTVGAALVLSLAAALGDACTPAVRAAWIELYVVISATMTAAACPTAKPMPSGMPAEMVAAKPMSSGMPATVAAKPMASGMPATVAAMAMAVAAGAAIAAEPSPFGTHPAMAPRALVATVAAPRPAIDPNTFILGHPASPTTRGGHANFEHPAVQIARLAGRPAIDPNTCIVQPPAMVTWRVEPEDDVGSRMAQAPAAVEARNR